MATIEQCERCIQNPSCGHTIAPDCLPVSVFGKISERVVVATIGLNPALNEFYLNGLSKPRGLRLPIVQDYTKPNRKSLTDADIQNATKERDGYFRNPDREWHSFFEKMESLVSRVQTSWSYYSETVVHIDMVACATKERWGDLTTGCRSSLLTNCRSYFMASLAKLPHDTTLLLDGATVTNEMQQLGLDYRQIGSVQLINIRGLAGCLGEIKFGDKTFPFRSWSTPASKLTLPWRYDLAHWIRGTLPKA